MKTDATDAFRNLFANPLTMESLFEIMEGSSVGVLAQLEPKLADISQGEVSSGRVVAPETPLAAPCTACERAKELDVSGYIRARPNKSAPRAKVREYLARLNEAAFGSSAPRGSMNPLLGSVALGLAPLAQPYDREGNVTSMLRSRKMSIEDKISLMLSLIMNKQDREIEAQAEHIDSIQNGEESFGFDAQIGRGVIGEEASANPSVDIETLKLKRLIEKRGQMFDTLRQIIDRYNQTANGLIQSIRA